MRDFLGEIPEEEREYLGEECTFARVLGNVIKDYQETTLDSTLYDGEVQILEIAEKLGVSGLLEEFAVVTYWTVVEQNEGMI